MSFDCPSLADDFLWFCFAAFQLQNPHSYQAATTSLSVEQQTLLMEVMQIADNPTGNKEIFHIMRTDTLRVFVNVPQVFAPGIKIGQQGGVFIVALIVLITIQTLAKCVHLRTLDS